ncbi:MAG: DUF3089 domain-containing protein [Clostridia bacterium]|nr:DUF3089 domain-containing protein [Clostridia bacterium]
MRAVSEALNAEVDWNGETRVVTITVNLLKEKVDYALHDNWAYFAQGDNKESDVFLVAPTVYAGTETSHYLSLDDEKTKASFLGALNMERGIYDESARLYAPYYRQVGLNVYELPGDEREEYLTNSYKDVKDAFLYYFEHENNGRPYILAGFSQGADIVLRLIKDLFDDEKYTQNFVAAYPIGWAYTEDEVKKYPQLKPAQGETDTGVIITFNSEAEFVTRSLMVDENEKTYAINPLNWKTDSTPADKSLNLGAAFTDYSGNITKEIPQLTGAYLDPKRGVLKVTDVLPEDYPPRFSIFEEGVYHVYDYQFFFRNLQENVNKRVDTFIENSSSNANRQLSVR